MSEIKHEPVNREGWGPGPWVDEPDRLEFTAHGFPCLCVRGPLGAWCGYVAVPPGHQCHGLDYDAVYEVAPELRVHGGLTYANACAGTVCHVPEPGEPDDVHWLGFDMAHSGDYVPCMGRIRDSMGKAFHCQPWETYRDLHYAVEEVHSLAQQLAEMVS